jgi:hypothetical protein
MPFGQLSVCLDEMVYRHQDYTEPDLVDWTVVCLFQLLHNKVTCDLFSDHVDWTVVCLFQLLHNKVTCDLFSDHILVFPRI